MILSASVERKALKKGSFSSARARPVAFGYARSLDTYRDAVEFPRVLCEKDKETPLLGRSSVRM